MRWTLKLAAVIMVLLLLGMAFQPAVAHSAEDAKEEEPRFAPLDEVPGPFRELDELVAGLIAATTNMTDTDNDTIPDRVEWVIGTDPENPDSDYDQMTDMEEVENNTNPMKVDSNRDGIVDSLEVRGDVSDLDGDGVPNAWDSDNDGDGVPDSRDLCPFARTKVGRSFGFDINTSGEQTTIHFQLRTSDPDHMRLINQVWDWPDDSRGRMRDLDKSTEDLRIVPLLELSGDDMPQDPELDAYGVVTTEDKAYIPLYPIWHQGNIIALQGQMLYPEAAEPQSISFDMELNWRVSGQSDKVIKALESEDGKYLSIGEDGKLDANAVKVSDSAIFEYIDLGSGRVALRAANGLYLSLQGDGSIAASADRMGDSETFTKAELEDREFSLKAENGLHLLIGGGGSVSAAAADPETASPFKTVDMGVRPETTTLAVYNERFTLTGCCVQESHGTDVAVVYHTQNKLKTVSANLYLAYEFMRNASAEVADIPQMLQDAGMDMEVNTSSFDRMDQAMQALVQDMLKDAKDSFQEGVTLPIITLMKRRYLYADLGAMGQGSYELGTDLQVDMTSRPLIEKKTMKTGWYIESEDQPVEIEKVAEEMRDWDLDDEDLAALILLVAAWETGEELVVRVGPEMYDPEHPEVDLAIKIALKGFKYGLKGMSTIGKTIIFVKGVSRVYSALKSFGVWNILKSGWKGTKNALTSLKSFYSSASQIQKGFFGFVNAFNKVMKWLSVIGFIIDIGLALFTLYAVGSSYGWSAMGTYAAILYAVMMTIWAVLMFTLTLLSFIPKVGIIFTIISLIITAVETLIWIITGKTGSQWIMDWIVDWLTNVNTLVDLDMQVTNTDLEVDDKDGNGIDAGDRITFTRTVVAYVNVSEHGDYQDVLDSSFEPYTWVHVPHKSNSRTDSSSTTVDTDTDDTTYVGTTYELTGWAEPGKGYIDYPFMIGLSSDYKVQYEECWWLVWWHCDRKNTTDTIRTDPTTLYFDVMPGSVGDFANWRAITSNDSDGDGINDTKESDTDPWKWDTDGDGLGDAFELQIGFDPVASDADGDGLSDREEYNEGTDPSDADSDGDGLSDFAERVGWLINFEYEGVEFDWHVNSDPHLNDTDDDGLHDHNERLTLQNPRSRDTNGNGVQDRMRDYWVTEFAHRRSLPTSGRGFAMDVVVDEDGHFYATYDRFSGGGWIVKYAPNGSEIASWDLGGIVDAPMGITMDADGDLWVCNPGPRDERIIKLDRNGTMLETWNASDYAGNLNDPQFIAFDNDGNALVTDRETHRVEMYDVNGTHIKNFGGIGSGTGQFHIPTGIDVDEEGHIYVVDNNNDRIQKFDADGNYVLQWGSTGHGPGQFDEPNDLEVDEEGYVIVSEDPFESDYSRIQKFDSVGGYVANASEAEVGGFTSCYGIGLAEGSVYIADYEDDRVVELYHNLSIVHVDPVEYPDSDGDGLLDDVEEAGWVVAATRSTGPVAYDVTSDALTTDTDTDGLNDSRELDLGSDPRNPDTDGDGIPDYSEVLKGLNLTNWDTDGDGLDDGTEVTFGSDPLVPDTDGEGLNDLQEFEAGSHPRKNDTDEDGLDDAKELEFNSSLIDPDSDDDFMFDGGEWDVGTLPNNTDHDGDGLLDGHEFVYSTNATEGDSDRDGLADGLEVSMVMNPLSNDTDGDGVEDADELEAGLNPRTGDSDGDGVPDDVDRDHEILLDTAIYAVVDEGADTAGFVDALASEVDVELVSIGELLSDHRDARYVVLVGDPDAGAGTAGATIRDLLSSTPDILEGMRSGEDVHLAVRYGVWTETQTVVMLSKTYASDHFRVLGILRSMVVKVTDHALTFNYISPRACFKLDDVDTVLETDATVWTKLDEMAVFSVNLTAYTGEDAPHQLAVENGLEVDAVPLGKYVQIEVSEEVQSAGGDMVTGATLRVYYTVDELDRTGDGDADDPVDVDEGTLALYVHDGASGNWTRVSAELDWVRDAGVDTSDVELHGRAYAGNVWANVTRLSLFGVGGKLISSIRTTARPGPDVTVKVGDEVTFNGTASEGNGEVIGFTWTFTHQSRRVTLRGPAPTFTFRESGVYQVTLEVRDTYDGIGRATLNVTVEPLTISVRVGPIVDERSVPVRGATVRITVEGEVLTEASSFSGFSDFVVAATAAGSSVTVRIEKEGYGPQEYQTTIGEDGVLERSPQPLVKAEETKPPSGEEEAVTAGDWAIVAMLLALILLGLLLVMRRGKAPPWKREGDGGDSERGKAEP